MYCHLCTVQLNFIFIVCKCRLDINFLRLPCFLGLHVSLPLLWILNEFNVSTLQSWIVCLINKYEGILWFLLKILSMKDIQQNARLELSFNLNYGFQSQHFYFERATKFSGNGENFNLLTFKTIIFKGLILLTASLSFHVYMYPYNV